MISVVMLFNLCAKLIHLISLIPLDQDLLFLAAHAGIPPNVFKPEGSLVKTSGSEQAYRLFGPRLYSVPFHR